MLNGALSAGGGGGENGCEFDVGVLKFAFSPGMGMYESSSRSWNRAYSERKRISTSPTAPLRCLAIMNSATPLMSRPSLSS